MFNPFQPKIPRLTKQVAEQYIAMNIGIPPQQLNYTKIPDVPKEWKHSCVPTGVTTLQPMQLQYTDTIISFSYCSQCRKVLYHYESPQGYY